MDDLDRFYSRLLQVGLLVLDQALEAGDMEWARAEVQYLHNIPGLLGEPHAERHAYFWNDERAQYVEWITTQGSEHALSRMRTYYEPIWIEMEPLIVAKAPSVTSKRRLILSNSGFGLIATADLIASTAFLGSRAPTESDRPPESQSSRARDPKTRESSKSTNPADATNKPNANAG